MDFRRVHAFLAVADALSVTKAAERLRIAQPPLTRYIQQLEHELGVTLFVRHRNGVTLTDAGRHLLDKARTLDAAAADLFHAARRISAGPSNRLTVGIAWGLWDVINRIRVDLAARYPDLTIDASDCACDSNEQMRAGAFDVAIAREPFDRHLVHALPILEEPIQVVLSAEHPLAGAKSVRLRDLADEPLLLWERQHGPLLYDQVLDLYARYGIAATMIPTPGAGPFNHAGLMQVASGKGIYLCMGIPHASPQPTSGVAVVPLADHDATITICVAFRRGETSAVVEHFLQSVRSLFPQEARTPVVMRARSSLAS